MQRIMALLLDRDYIASQKGWRCWACGRITRDPRTLSVEHITPRSQGGTDALTNLALPHRSCNYSRGTQPIDAWREGTIDRSAWVASLNPDKSGSPGA